MLKVMAGDLADHVAHVVAAERPVLAAEEVRVLSRTSSWRVPAAGGQRDRLHRQRTPCAVAVGHRQAGDAAALESHVDDGGVEANVDQR